MPLSDEVFARRLARSGPSVRMVQAWLKEYMGIEAAILKPEDEPVGDHKDWKKNADHGDLVWDDEYGHHIIQVKRRPDMHFSSNWDFPYTTIIVSEVWKHHHYSKRDGEPLGHFIVSDDLQAMIWIAGDSYLHWRVERKWDRFYREMKDYYTIPRGLVVGGPTNVAGTFEGAGQPDQAA